MYMKCDICNDTENFNNLIKEVVWMLAASQCKNYEYYKKQRVTVHICFNVFDI